MKGWGISTGLSVSYGVNYAGSRGTGLDVGFDGKTAGSISLGYGAGISPAPVPYFQTRIGYTGTIYKFNLLDVLKKWYNNVKKSLWFLGMNITVTKQSKYVKVYVKPLKKNIYLYKGGKVKVK